MTRWRRSRALILIAAIGMAALTARLGFWQLDRAAQKNEIQARVDARRDMPPLPAPELARSPAEADTQHHRAIELQGRWLARHTVYLDNRPMDGRVGFVVVTPLALDDGSAVLVQRGWLPRDPIDRTRITPPPTPTERVSVRGRIAPSPPRLYEFESGGEGAIRQNLDLSAFGRETGLALRPVSILQSDGPDAAADGLLRRWPVITAGVHKHYGYAFQWFALSALTIALYVWFQLIRPRRRAAAQP